VDGGNSGDIAWGVKKLLGMSDKGKHVGKNARKRVLEKFTWKHVAERTINIYKEFS
jgi:glycosyltransferase involved in cell wall biosynthesis